MEDMSKLANESTWIVNGELKRIDPEIYAKAAKLLINEEAFCQLKELEQEHSRIYPIIYLDIFPLFTV